MYKKRNLLFITYFSFQDITSLMDNREEKLWETHRSVRCNKLSELVVVNLYYNTILYVFKTLLIYSIAISLVLLK